MAKQVVLWEADKAGGTFQSPVLADLADAKSDIHELINGDNEVTSLHSRPRLLEPFKVSEFIINNWTELVELIPKYINLQEKARLESENARKNHNEERLQD